MADPEDDALAVERSAVLLLEEALDVPETYRTDWIAGRTADPRVKARLEAMLEADRESELRTGAAAILLASETARRMPERFGAYRVTGLLGRGGMGAVYRAERDAGDFARVVAVKLVKPGLLSDALAERLAAERQRLADLPHPNIARLYDGGTTADGAPFIVMELVEGEAIDRHAEARQLDVAARLRLVEQLADAVAHAHRRLIVHRDITPANVLVAADGVPKLIDFGIARDAGGGASEATTAVDVAALGRMIRRLVPQPDQEVSAIIARATAQDEAARYPTADALREDLVAWRTGQPVAAMDGGAPYRARKFVARNHRAVAASAVLLLALMGALAALTLANARTEAARKEAEVRFEATRGIARLMLFKTFDSVSQVPGSTAARQMLAESGVHYLDELAAGAGGRVDVAAEAGRGFVRLSEVTGGGAGGSLGRYADAAALLARGAAILEPLHRRHPTDPIVAEAYATLRLEQAAQDLHNANNPARGRERAAEAETVLARIAGSGPTTARMYAAAIRLQGDSYGWEDDYPAALPHHQRAEEWLSGQPEAIAASREVLVARSANLRALAEAQHKQKMVTAARRSNDAAVALNRRLVAMEPANPLYQRMLSQSLWYAGVVHRSNYRDAEAKRSMQEALGLAQGLASRDPADEGAQKMVALTGEVMAQIYADEGNGRESALVADKILAIHRRLVEAAGDSPGALRSMTAAMRTIGGNRYNVGDLAGACTIWRDALSNYAALEGSGALTDYDRQNGVPELTRKSARVCAGRTLEGVE